MSGGSYGNNTRVIFCPALGRRESAAGGQQITNLAGLSIIGTGAKMAAGHALSIVMHAIAWRRQLLLYTSRCKGQPLQFHAKIHAVIL